MINVDGNVYRWLGPEDGVATEVAQQLGLAQVGATTTNYSFAVYPPGTNISNGSVPSVLFNVSFRSDALVDGETWDPTYQLYNAAKAMDPVTFILVAADSGDGLAHNVSVYFDTTAEGVVRHPTK